MSSSSVISVGIGKYTNENTLLFQPRIQKSYSFYLFDSPRIAGSIEGELAEYATLKDPSPNGGPRNIEVILNLPEYIEPGAHVLYIVATQSSESGGTVGGIASVRTPITVFALYPNKHPEFAGVGVGDLNIGDKSNAEIYVTNYGEEAIEAASGTLTVKDPFGNLVGVLYTGSASIAPFESKTIGTIFDSTLYNLSAGVYSVSGTLTYDGQKMDVIKESKFIVGQMNVEIIETTNDLIVNSTNKYYITLESDWSGDIDNVYARVTLPTGKVVKSPNVDLIKGSQGVKAAGEVEMYIETDDLPLGTNELTITLYYKGEVSEKKVNVNIINGQNPNFKKPVDVDKIVIISMSILVVCGIILFFVFKKPKNGSGASYKPASTSSSAGDIKPPSL